MMELFTQKIVSKLSKIWIWDPGSEIRDPEKTCPGSRGQKGTGSRIRLRNTELITEYELRITFKSKPSINIWRDLGKKTL
jgi:hypothetical protein